MLKIENINLFEVKKVVEGKITFIYDDETYLLSENQSLKEISLVKKIFTNKDGDFYTEPISTIKGCIPDLYYHSRYGSTKHGNCYGHIDIEKLVFDLTIIGLVGGCFEEQATATLRKKSRLEKAIEKQKIALIEEEEALKELQKSIEKRKKSLDKKTAVLKELLETL